jgi:hypothetical protein
MHMLKQETEVAQSPSVTAATTPAAAGGDSQRVLSPMSANAVELLAELHTRAVGKTSCTGEASPMPQ